MFVTEVTGFEESNTNTSIKEPDWGRIEELIRQLNGEDKSLLTLNRGDEVPHMSIGGGGGQYVAYVTFDNVQFYTVTIPDNADDKILMFVGGQMGEYQQKQCSDLSTVLRAAKTFAEKGELDPSVNWVQT